MKKLLFFLVIVFFSYSLNAQDMAFDWGYALGPRVGGADIVEGQNGNVYTVGSFTGAFTDFDRGPGVFILPYAGGSNDVFIHTQDSNGNFLWVKGLGGPDNDNGYSISSDENGNVYVLGTFRGTVDFDPGSGVFNLISAGEEDVFILKLDASGNFIWAKSIENISRAFASSIICDSSGHIYFMGTYYGLIDFDPGPGTFNLMAQGMPSSAFITKLDTNGIFLWAKSNDGMGETSCNAGVIDINGNVYTTGRFRDTVDFDPGPLVFNLISNGGHDAYIKKLDSSGNFLWAKSYGGNTGSSFDDEGISIVADTNENVYVSGYFKGLVDFNPGIGVFNLTSSFGGRDMYVEKLDINGDFIWVKQMRADNSGSSSRPKSICLDDRGFIYVTGVLGSTVDFDPGIGIFNLSSSTVTGNVFFQKLDTNGNFIWAGSIFSNGLGIGSSIIVSENKSVYVTGSVLSGDLDPGPGTHLVPAIGFGGNMLTLKLKDCISDTVVDVVVACDSLIWIDGNTYVSSNNTATYTLTNVLGCDSVITLDLSIFNTNTSVDSIIACDSYSWTNGISYSSSNSLAKDTLINSLGCDSIVTLNLSIVNSSSSIDSVSSCMPYTWINGVTYSFNNSWARDTLANYLGCDSIITLNLEINSNSSIDIINSCDSIVWIDGNVYSSNNFSVMDTLVNISGCDSIVTLNLTINTVDNTVTQFGNIIGANQSGAAYQWLDCDNANTIIVGETSQNFTVFANGNYAVEVIKSNCTDTSICINITGVGVENSGVEMDALRLYPNPTKGLVTVLLSNYRNATLEVYDIIGQKIIHKKVLSKSTFVDLSSLEKGVYLIRVVSEESLDFRRITKQ